VHKVFVVLVLVLVVVIAALVVVVVVKEADKFVDVGSVVKINGKMR
jgi:hypothetical protein